MSELVHYGVKGMKWGVRRAEANKRNASYSKSQRDYDRRNFGNGGVKRINRRMNKGATLAKARKMEVKTRRRRSTLYTAGLLAAAFPEHAVAYARFARDVVRLSAGVAAHKVAQRAETKRGQAAAAEAMGLPRNPTDGPTYSKRNRQGVYNISSM